MRSTVETAARIGIHALTLYAFSEENWKKRPKTEVDFLMSLLSRYLKQEVPTLNKNNIQLQYIGRRHELPKAVQDKMQWAQDATAKNNGMILTLALNYSARSELVDAFKSIVDAAMSNGGIDHMQIDEDAVSQNLYTGHLPDPDLVIRTSGEMRLSNFLLWQLAYAEIYVTPTLWPGVSAASMVHVGQARRQDDARGVMVARARQRGKIRQLRQRDVHAEGAGAGFPRFHARRHRAGGTASGGTKVWNRRCGSTLAMTARARIAVPSSSTTPVARPRSTMTSRTAAPTSMRTPCAPAALAIACVIAPMPPMAWPHTPRLPFTSPKHVMQQHVGGARRVRARQIADDRIEAEHGLDRIGLEPAVEHLAGRFAEQLERRRRRHRPATASCRSRRACRASRTDWLKLPQHQIGRRLEHEAAQHIGDAADLGLIVAVARGILGAEFCDLALGAALAGEEIAAVRQRQEVLRAALDDAQAMLVQLRDRG